MKKISAGKKVSLSKETLRSLDPGSLEEVNGGITFTVGVVVGIGISLAFCDEFMERLR